MRLELTQAEPAKAPFDGLYESSAGQELDEVRPRVSRCRRASSGVNCVSSRARKGVSNERAGSYEDSLYAPSPQIQGTQTHRKRRRRRRSRPTACSGRDASNLTSIVDLDLDARTVVHDDGDRIAAVRGVVGWRENMFRILRRLRE